MKKQKLPPHIKDPKKVAAGKARAASAIKDKQGKYVSRVLYNEIARISLALKGEDVSKVNSDNSIKIASLMRSAGVSAKEVKQLYEDNPIAFADIIERGTITGTSQNSNRIEQSITDFQGDIFINDKLVTKAGAKKALMEFKQFLSVNLNVVDFTIRPALSFDGEMRYKIPDVRKLIMDVVQYFEVDSVNELSQFDGAEITEAIDSILGDNYDLVIYSSDKKKHKEKFEKKREEIVHKQVSVNIRKSLCGVPGDIVLTKNKSLVTCVRCLDKIYTVK